MALTPTEREEHFFKAMVDAADGNTPEELEPTERREHWYKEIIDAIKAGGGSGGGVLVVTDTDGTLDKTWHEIHDAMLVGGAVVSSGDDAYVADSAYYDAENSEYTVTAPTGSNYYVASSADGYPTLAN